MNYKQSQILVLASLLTLISYNYSQGVVAKPPQATPTVSPVTPHPDAEVAPTDLTYKLETYKSQVMGGKRTYGVSLPPGYEKNPQQRYPVIFLLHGGHGDPTAWFDQKKGQALKTLEQLYAIGKLPLSPLG
ncbi:MAG: hypothetical protein HEQ35_16865 [Gloeotrichia echinulata IR180]